MVKESNSSKTSRDESEVTGAEVISDEHGHATGSTFLNRGKDAFVTGPTVYADIVLDVLGVDTKL